MGHITCVRGAGSPVVYIICDLVGKGKGFIKNYDWILVRTIRQCHLARWGENIRCQTPGTKLGWRAVFAMTELFSAVAPGVAEKLGYEYSFEEEQSCMEFLEHVRNMPEDADEF